MKRSGYDVVLIAPGDREEIVDGVRVRPVQKTSSRLGRMTRTVWRVFRIALDEHADIYHFHDPELIPVGVLLKLTGRRVIYDVHENVPENILAKAYIHAPIKKIVAAVAKMTEYAGASCFDAIVAATPAIAQRFPSAKTITVQNYPLLEELVAIESSPYAERPQLVAYVGAITAVRGIKEMIQAMTWIPTTLNAKLVLAGNCDSDLEAEIRQLAGWRYVDFPGWLSRDEVTGLLSNTRVGLVLLHPVGGYVESHPIKMFEYMAAGVPVVASDFPLWREIISNSQCGIVVDPLDTKAIAAAIRWLLEHPDQAAEMGKNGREAVRAKYNWATEAQELRKLYGALSAASTGNGACASLVSNRE